MKHSDDKLVFEVNESLTFTRDKQISEMISISLDPDIVVQSYEKYVHIRGVILLQGEYVKESTPEPLDDDYERFQDRNIRYIEHVKEKRHDNSIAMFSHRFPVDITVPHYRVKRLEDISINIDAFDYDLPEPSKLNVYATLHIYGIATEQIEQDEDKDQKQRKQDMDQVKKEEALQYENKDISSDANENKNNLLKDNVNTTAKQNSKQLKDDENQVQNEAISNTEMLQDNREGIGQSENVNAQANREEETIEIQLNENTEELQEQEIKDVTFLTELFSEAEEKFTELKIYIAQDDDTVESIAKRYKVSVLQLMKDNHLLEDSIQGGQLIKIYKHKSHQ